MLKRFLTSFILALTTVMVFAQTPYDSFAPEQSVKTMNELPKSVYLLENPDPSAEVKHIIIDWTDLSYQALNQEGKIVKDGHFTNNDIKFLSIDKLAEDTPQVSPYVYCMGNPVNAVDLDGNKTIFINGYIGFGSPPAGAPYWNGSNSGFVKGAKNFLNDNNVTFANVDHNWYSTAWTRGNAGYIYAKEHYNEWVASMHNDEPFNLISHSMGAAFSVGVEKYLREMGRSVNYNIMLNSYQIDGIEINPTSSTIYIDYKNTNDPVLNFLDSTSSTLQNATYILREPSNNENILEIHRSPIDNYSEFWNTLINFIMNNNF